MKNRCTKEKENPKNNSDFRKRQETGKRKMMRKNEVQKGKEENEVENENRGCKKHKR